MTFQAIVKDNAPYLLWSNIDSGDALPDVTVGTEYSIDLSAPINLGYLHDGIGIVNAAPYHTLQPGVYAITLVMTDDCATAIHRWRLQSSTGNADEVFNFDFEFVEGVGSHRHAGSVTTIIPSSAEPFLKLSLMNNSGSTVSNAHGCIMIIKLGDL